MHTCGDSISTASPQLFSSPGTQSLLPDHCSWSSRGSIHGAPGHSRLLVPGGPASVLLKRPWAKEKRGPAPMLCGAAPQCPFCPPPGRQVTQRGTGLCQAAPDWASRVKKKSANFCLPSTEKSGPKTLWIEVNVHYTSQPARGLCPFSCGQDLQGGKFSCTQLPESHAVGLVCLPFYLSIWKSVIYAASGASQPPLVLPNLPQGPLPSAQWSGQTPSVAPVVTQQCSHVKTIRMYSDWNESHQWVFTCGECKQVSILNRSLQL